MFGKWDLVTYRWWVRIFSILTWTVDFLYFWPGPWTYFYIFWEKNFSLYFALHIHFDLQRCIFCTPYTSIYRDVYFALHIHLNLQRCIFCTPHTPGSTEMYILHSTYTSIYIDIYFVLHIHFNLQRCIFCTPHTLLWGKYQIGYNSLLFDVQSFKSHVEEGGGVMFLILCIAFFLK